MMESFGWNSKISKKYTRGSTFAIEIRPEMHRWMSTKIRGVLAFLQDSVVDVPSSGVCAKGSGICIFHMRVQMRPWTPRKSVAGYVKMSVLWWWQRQFSTRATI
jgi:hypothetical protein